MQQLNEVVSRNAIVRFGEVVEEYVIGIVVVEGCIEFVVVEEYGLVYGGQGGERFVMG